MLAGLACLLVLAQGEAPKTETSFVADVSVAQPGVPFTVALKIKMAPEWHTYFQNPGDAGQATAIHWQLPPGFKIGPIQWPVPRREDFQGIASYVYEDEVWLLNTVTIDKTWKVGKPLHLAAHVTWLLCSTACVPQSSDLIVDIPVGSVGEANEVVAEGFAKARKALPVVDDTLKPVAVASGKSVNLSFATLTSSAGARFIPRDVDSFGANEAKASLANGHLRMNLPLTPYAKKLPARIQGILVVKDRAYAVDVPVVQA